MEWRISNLIIAMMIVGFFVTIFSFIIISFTTEYEVEYDNSSFSSFNKMHELSETANESYNKISSMEPDDSFFSKLDAFVSSGYGVIKTTTKSVTITNEIINDGIGQSNIGFSGEYLKILLTTVIIIIVGVGIILSAIFKWRL